MSHEKVKVVDDEACDGEGDWQKIQTRFYDVIVSINQTSQVCITTSTRKHSTKHRS